MNRPERHILSSGSVSDLELRQNRPATAAIWLGGGTALSALAAGRGETLYGFLQIQTAACGLVTDYFALGGAGGALLNLGVMLLMTAVAIRLSGDACHGVTLVELGLMAGFSLFGKTLVNTWPILLGTWLYAKHRREPFRRYLAVGLLSTALAPLVSWLTFESAFASPLLGAAAGVAVGYVMPVLSSYTFRILNGVNLYNAGFACGVLGILVVPVLSALGDRPEGPLLWSKDYDAGLCFLLLALCMCCIVWGLLHSRPSAAWNAWLCLLRSSGRVPCDYLRDYGPGAVAFNMGVNGLVGTGYLLAVGGTCNGPTVGGVLTMMAFSAYGKHLRNTAPVMLGAWLGAMVLHRSPASPGQQLAALFGTTLAPVSGLFGWPAGVLAGVLHAALVAQTGGWAAGVNLYNNGFSGGIVAIVLYPLFTELRHRRPSLQEADYLDSLEGLPDRKDAHGADGTA